ncbi:MAG: ABC transporter substrate-binding protein [Casimicrobiaceae bacterium]
MRTRLILVVVGIVLAGAGCGARAQGESPKVLRVAFPVAETGFDPQAAGDIYSNAVNREIFDTLYRYDYLARPHRRVPNVAAGMPEISADGKTWSIRLRPGIVFADDPVWTGQRRELVAADFVYAWKRILDPRMRSSALQIFEGRIAGAEPVLAKGKETGKLDWPWKLAAFRYANVVVQPWVIGYKYNGYHAYPFRYLDIDLQRRAGAASGRG